VISVTRLDGSTMLLNTDLIVTIEQTPDTLISLTTSERVIVRETPDELVTRITQWKRDVARPLASAADGAAR
jgi:flagellar protein FlbD